MAREFEGRRVAQMMLVLVMLTAVIPPAAAYALAQWRIARAERSAETGAATLSARKAELRDAAGTLPVLCGPGRYPRGQGPSLGWVENPLNAGGGLGRAWPQDPWGRCFLLHVRAVLESGGGLLLSAGPNGIVDTPFGATYPAGDDIGVLVR